MTPDQIHHSPLTHLVIGGRVGPVLWGRRHQLDVDQVRVLEVLGLGLVVLSLLALRVTRAAGRFSKIMDRFSSAQSREDFKTINPYKTLLEL